MLNRLLPKEKAFFELFDVQSGVIAKGIELFEELLRDYGRQPELAPLIKMAEEKADEAAHRIFQLTANTFIAPFDREDIRDLAHTMDDVMDLVEKASARMDIYAMPEPPPGLDEMAALLGRAFALAGQAVAMLGSLKKRDDILGICIEINRLENEGDALLRKFLRKLFHLQTDALYAIKAKELYESLEDAIDRCEDLANIIETIVVKNV